MVEELIEHIARSLVDKPDAVSVEVEDRGRIVYFGLRVDQSDMGKVIGRQGKIARAFRSLVGVAAAREGIRASLDIREA